MDRQYYVYILTNRPRGTLYVGFTSDLPRRLWEHKAKALGGFTARYRIDRLVYYEIFDAPAEAIAREKRLKRYMRQWKYNLVEASNPRWEEVVLTP
jgi:putative endonuclease